MRRLTDPLIAALAMILIFGSLGFLFDLLLNLGLGALFRDRGVPLSWLQGTAVFAVLCLPIGIMTAFRVRAFSFATFLGMCAGWVVAWWIYGGRFRGVADYLYDGDWDGLRDHLNGLYGLLIAYAVIALVASLLRLTPWGKSFRVIRPHQNPQ